MDDVVIVGAGPAGNNAALNLANNGIGVRVIDARTEIGNKLCTGIIGAECARRFPIEDQLVYQEGTSARLVTPEKNTLQFSVSTPQAKIIDRVSYVASFATRAQEAGARYQLGEQVLKIDSDGDGVSIQTDQAVYWAKSVVLASGFGSPFTQRLGLGKISDYVTAVQVEVPAPQDHPVEVHLGQAIAPGFFAWIVPTKPGRALVGLLARRKAQKYLESFLRQLHAAGRVGESTSSPARWGIPLRPLRRTYGDRILVVGDAAGQVKPTTGGGIYYSLLSSEIAAGVLTNALAQGDLSSRVLKDYQQQWKALLGAELEAGYSARRLYEYLSDGQISSLARQADENGLQKELTEAPELSFDWHSQMIEKVLNHPVLSGMFSLVNPLLASIAHRPSKLWELGGNPQDQLVSTGG